MASVAPILETVTFSLNGEQVQAFADESILQAAKRHGVEIPHLCYSERQGADGNCRACVVEIDGERTLAPSCCRAPKEGMVVNTQSERASKSQKMVLEMLASEVSDSEYNPKSELTHWRMKLNVDEIRLPRRAPTEADVDNSHPGISVNLDACIQCTRCLRACRDEQANDVIGLSGRGHFAKIVFDIDDEMGKSSCVGCGECVQACPTGALMPSKEVGKIEPDKQVNSVCPYCGVGCLLTYNVKDNQIISVDGRQEGPANLGRLCVKGRFGFDYASNPQRLTTPLIRREGVPKGMNEHFDPADPMKMFREATWEEAMSLAAGGLKGIRDQHGPKALAGFGSAKGSNEEAYLFQKLVRVGFGSNNVDHCTRLCHASSVAALLEGIGSGAVSNQVSDVENADLIMIIGSNTAVNHPVAATFIKNEHRKGKTLIIMDPRRNQMARHADHFLQFKPDSDVAMLNAMINVIITEGLVDEAFIAERTEDYDLVAKNIAPFTPEAMSELCGISPEKLREVARLYATSKGSMIFWGMGVSQHTHGTDNVRCLITLAMITGQVGRPGTGLHPLRGQNNVQGASDAGLIPMMFPDYKRVDNPEANQWFSEYWGAKLDDKPGLTVVEIMHAAHDGDIKGMYVQGENPAMSDPNLNHAREALATLDHLVVQDIFLTETAAFADVVLPASAWPEKNGTVSNTDRRVQMGRQAVLPPGQARQDLEIIIEMAQRMGLDWHYNHVSEVYEEMRVSMKSITGITWDRLEANDSVTYPCANSEDPGQGTVFVEQFPTASGKARLVPTQFLRAAELPDADYPFVLITGRQLEHWHTGSMTRRASVLDTIEPEPIVHINPNDLQRLGIAAGEDMRLNTRRGEVVAIARADDGMSEGEVFMPFCYHEAAANILTNEALDPFGKIAELKYCAVNVSAV